MKIPKQLLKSKERKIMWENARQILKKLEKTIPITGIYVRGSFTTTKKRPADVDFIIIAKTSSNKKQKWSTDLVIVPENAYGKQVIKDADKWMKQKYGSKKSAFIQLK